MLNVLVSNGCAEAAVVDKIAPFIDAANIDRSRLKHVLGV